MKLFARHNLDELGEDEPVFLIRGRDADGPGMLRKFAFVVRSRHGAHGLADEILEFADELFAWQHAEGNGAPPPEPEEPVDVAERLEPYATGGLVPGPSAEEVLERGGRKLDEEELLEEDRSS